MKFLIIIILVLLNSSITGKEKLPGKKILIDSSMYSKKLPSLWFSPKDSHLLKNEDGTEIPPDEKYSIWIEPNDPEFSSLHGKGYFLFLGNGETIYQKATIDSEGTDKAEHANLVKGNPVYLYVEGEDKYVFMLISIDAKKQTMSFMWHNLTPLLITSELTEIIDGVYIKKIDLEDKSKKIDDVELITFKNDVVTFSVGDHVSIKGSYSYITKNDINYLMIFAEGGHKINFKLFKLENDGFIITEKETKNNFKFVNIQK